MLKIYFIFPENNKMYEIISNLYLSGFYDVKVSPDSFIVNCTKDLKMLSENGIRIAVNDDASPDAIRDMFLALPDIVNIIDTQLKNQQQVIVHCNAGQQRSPTVIAAYLVGKRGKTNIVYL
jgi:protein-tyrosine phosphatase